MGMLYLRKTKLALCILQGFTVSIYLESQKRLSTWIFEQNGTAEIFGEQLVCCYFYIQDSILLLGGTVTFVIFFIWGLTHAHD